MYWQLLRRRQKFRNLWLGAVVSMAGDWFTLLALYSLLLERTGGAQVRATASLAEGSIGTFNSTNFRLLTNNTVRMHVTTAGNVGITQFQARRSLVDPLGYEILTSVRNASNQPVECRLELELDGVPVDVQGDA